MKKRISLQFWLNGLLTAAVCILNYFYQADDFNYTIKCCASVCFALLGPVNLWYARQNGCKAMGIQLWLALGLVFAMLGDIAINPNFVLGAALFALGHIFLVVAYGAILPIGRPDAVLSLLLASLSVAFLLLYPHFTFEHPVFHVICIVYAVIISAMLGKAGGNFLRRPSRSNGLLALGSALFFFSDLMLLLHWFVGRWDWTDSACMAAYYPSVCIIGWAMYVRQREA